MITAVHKGAGFSRDPQTRLNLTYVRSLRGLIRKTKRKFIMAFSMKGGGGPGAPLRFFQFFCLKTI